MTRSIRIAATLSFSLTLAFSSASAVAQPRQRQQVPEEVRTLVRDAVDQARAEHAAEAPRPRGTELTVQSGTGDATQRVQAQGRAAGDLAQFRDFTPIATRTRSASISADSIVSTATWKTIAQFVNDFYQNVLARQPDANEFQHWSGRLTTAQAQGRAQLLAEGQAFGRALFQSQEYVNRGRTDPRDYVYDLYKGFLQREPDQGGWDWWTGEVIQWGRPTGLQAFVVCFEYEHKLYMLTNAAADADQDGFAQSFEDDLANFFTPVYFVSGNEPNSFARFGDFVPQVPIQGLGANPASHFRVQPLGWGRDTAGRLYSFARIDYLTLWDHDSGLDFGFFCDFNIAATGDFGGAIFLQLLDQLSSHPLDNERSAALVAARVEDFYFNPNPNEYKLYDLFLSAHENTISDSSAFIAPSTPLPADSHVFLYLSRSKHGTYEFNPSGWPLVPFWLQIAIYSAIDSAFFAGWIDEWTWSFYRGSAENAFNNCIVEQFSDIGGRFANPRINVGEPNTPINGSGFIRAPELFNKLSNPLWAF